MTVSIFSAKYELSAKEIVMKDDPRKLLLHKVFSESFNLPESACQWLLMIWDLSQFFDDVADGDPIDREDVDAAIWNALVGTHTNEFFYRNSSVLLPLLSTAILKWKASDTVELDKKPTQVSFVWRAGFYDLVLASLQICHGTKTAMENAHHVLSLYGESYEDYVEEFNHG